MIQKHTLSIVQQSEKVKLKNQDLENAVKMAVTPLLHTEQRANYRKEQQSSRQEIRKTFLRLCQSVRKIEFKPLKQIQTNKRLSRSIEASPKLKSVLFMTPIQEEKHKKFQKTPFPKYQIE